MGRSSVRLRVWVAAAVALTGALLAIAAPWVAPYPPEEAFFDGLTLEGAPLAPGGRFWFGTDLLGRDLLSRVIHGAQTSLVIGLVANGVALLIGTLSRSWRDPGYFVTPQLRLHARLGGAARAAAARAACALTKCVSWSSVKRSSG
jgi:hypothetical protein